MSWKVPGSHIACDLGVGCNETGICYAVAHGQPDKCGVNIVDGLNLAAIAPMTEQEADELFERNRAVTWEECEYAINDLPVETGNVIRRYIAHLNQRLQREKARSNELSHTVGNLRDPRGGNY